MNVANYKKSASLYLILFFSGLLFYVAPSACSCLERTDREIIDDMIYDSRYEDALERVNDMLDEDEEDPDLWEYLARLTTNARYKEIYNPETGFFAYEKLYYLLDERDEKQRERLDELPEEIDGAWVDAIMEMTRDVSYDTQANYDRFAGKGVPVFLFFEADWCRWCKKMTESVESFDADFLDRALVIRVDVDRDSGSLVNKYNVKGIPRSIFIDRKGNEASFSGWMTDRKLFAAYLAITDFFYEDYLNEGESLSDYINRIHKRIGSISDEELEEMVSSGKRIIF